MRYIVIVLIGLFFFSGCVANQPKVEKEETKILKKASDKNITALSTASKDIKKEIIQEETIQKDVVEEGEVIVNVFDDELYFEKDKVGTDKTKVVIKYLDAFDWEKKALQKIYKKHKKLWSKKQSKNFKNILKNDKYLALCGDRRYWDNLEFEESEPEQDILQSVLLIKYLNNVMHGCPEWVESNGKIKDENSKKHMNSKEIFSLLVHGVIIKKLFSLSVPKDKNFYPSVEKYKALLTTDVKKEILKKKRLMIENYKCKRWQPNYVKKESR